MQSQCVIVSDHHNLMDVLNIRDVAASFRAAPVAVGSSWSWLQLTDSKSSNNLSSISLKIKLPQKRRNSDLAFTNISLLQQAFIYCNRSLCFYPRVHMSLIKSSCGDNSVMAFSHTAVFNLPHRYLSASVTGLLRASCCHNTDKAEAALYHISISHRDHGGDPGGATGRTAAARWGCGDQSHQISSGRAVIKDINAVHPSTFPDVWSYIFFSHVTVLMLLHCKSDS